MLRKARVIRFGFGSGHTSTVGRTAPSGRGGDQAPGFTDKSNPQASSSPWSFQNFDRETYKPRKGESYFAFWERVGYQAWQNHNEGDRLFFGTQLSDKTAETADEHAGKRQFIGGSMQMSQREHEKIQAHERMTVRGTDNRLRNSAAVQDQRYDPYKSIAEIDSPTSRRLTRNFLEGKIVGVLIFSDDQKNWDFLNLMGEFQKRHAPDFVCVCVSLGHKEYTQRVKALKMYYIRHVCGGRQLLLDLGFSHRGIVPLPRLVILDPYGAPITKSGYSAVCMRFDTCFKDWLQGQEGWQWYDPFFAHMRGFGVSDGFSC